MKNLNFSLVAFAAVALLLSCGGENAQSSDSMVEERPVAATEAGLADQAALVQEGKALVEGSDCRACHGNEQRIVGPSYKEVAERYHDNPEAVDMLANKIIQGGAGNWGEVQMTPHPQLSVEDATKMVHYVLSLRGSEGGAPQAN